MSVPLQTSARSFDLAALYAERGSERYTLLHTRYINGAIVKVLKTRGYEAGFRRGKDAYLFDRHGEKYLDLLSGWGAFARTQPPGRAQRRSSPGSTARWL